MDRIKPPAKLSRLTDSVREATPSIRYALYWTIIYLLVALTLTILFVLEGIPRLRTDFSVDGFFSIVLIIGLWALAWHFGVQKLLVARSLNRRGQTALGKITQRWMDDQHHVAYEFMEGFKAKQDVDPETFETLHVDDQVKVRYLPEDPTCSRLELADQETRAEN